MKKLLEQTGFSLNLVWVLLTGYMIMFMQAGFAMVETGFTRAKNCGHTMAMNFMVYTIAMTGYWICGFAIQWGGTADPVVTATMPSAAAFALGPDINALNKMIGITIGDKFYGLFGAKGFFLLGDDLYKGPILALFMFQMLFMDTTATIPTGTLAERWKFTAFIAVSFVIGAFIYPMFGCWVWGGGWLSALGKNLGLGHGMVDFAGSSVVHLCGGTLALVGAKIVGARIGKFNKDGSANPIPGHNIPMAVVGTFILAFGWFGFNPGSSLSGMDTHIGVIAVNTMLASASGAITGMTVTWLRFGKPDPSFMCNGMLAGLVAITGPCAFVDPWAAYLIGAIAGVLVIYAVEVVDACRLDDPVGAISVHGVNGAWGIIALGIFANGKYGGGWNGVDGNVRGLISGDVPQLVAQLIGIVTCIVFVGTCAWITFTVVEALIGNRVSAEDEMEGLDIPELGILGYQADLNPEEK